MPIDWTGYLRVHGERRNLILYLFFLTGCWWRQFKASSGGSDNAS